IKTCDHYQQFPLYLAGERHEHYGIPHGFSSRVALERYLNGLNQKCILAVSKKVLGSPG
ncbi:DUF2002 family protein, partial [Escherichia coli]|uniref:DUF2002 family protein n=1 Tax=Escherichia coli TaxID=562 RepID=UPI00128FF9B2